MEYSGTQTDSHASTTNIGAVLIRTLGAIVLGAGLYVAFTVVNRAWELFDNHDRVVHFGEAIEKNSNLNSWAAQLNSIIEIVSKMKPFAPSAVSGSEPVGAQPINPAPAAVAQPVRPQPFLNASYFVAWLLTIILLSLVGRISFWMITSGSQILANSFDQNKQLKSVLRELLVEVKRGTPRMSTELAEK